MGGVIPPHKFYRFEGSTLVETTENDPQRLMQKHEVDRAFADRVFVSAFLGIGITLAMRSLYKACGVRR